MDPAGPDLACPPLSRWQWTWRYASALVIGSLTWASEVGAEWSHVRWLFWADLGLGLLGFLVYRFHRRWPVGVAVLTTALGALSAAVTGPAVLAFVSMATRRRWREIIPVSLLNIVCGMAFVSITPERQEPWYVDVIFTVLGTGIAVAIGLYIGARRELLATLRDRADRAEREQAMRVAQARATERSRIAREMHDVLAHRISLVAMHAGALAYRTDLTPRETTEAADVIQQNAHQALVDLREILGVLRDSDGAPKQERPQPTLNDLGTLIDGERGAGAHIRLRTSVPLDQVPESVGRSAFRIVQESLTNARKHAPDTTVDVGLAGEPGATLRITVSNPLRVGGADSAVPGAGLGLIGLAERAALSGGGLDHRTTPAGDFVLRAWLPWPT